ncbi:MAG: lysylphosphatidylglycerol synthase transmembrane domain-containing protein [Thermoplasmatota archaeon]
MRVLWRAVRWLLVGLVILVALFFVPSLQTEAKNQARSAQDVLAAMQPIFLLLAAVAAAAWIVSLGVLIRESAVAVGRPLPLSKCLLLGLALQFVNAFPAGSLARLVYETRAIERMGVPRGTAMLIVGVETVVFFATFVILLLFGLGFVALANGAPPVLILGAALLAIILGGVSIAGLVILGDPVRAAGLREFLVSRFGENRGVGRSFDEVSLAVQRIRESPRILVKPLLSATAHWGASLVVLAVVFLAFGLHPSPGLVIAGFSISFLVGSLTPIPAGLGAVDATLAGVLIGMGLGSSEAVLVTLAFRVLTLLIPAIVGFFAHHVLVQVSSDMDRVIPAPIADPEAEETP